MMRNWIIVGICLLMLTGCGGASRSVFPRHYTLDVAPLPTTHERVQAASGETLRVAGITVPIWLQGTGLYYRLEYRRDHRIATYAHSDWVAPPAHMLEPVIQDTITTGGAWRVVIGPDNPAAADFSLRIRLEDFSQVFTSAHDSHALLDATVTLIDNRSHDAVAQKRFSIRVAAPSANAAGGVEALSDASRQFATRLQRWLATR